jgi:hypothetical protein
MAYAMLSERGKEFIIGMLSTYPPIWSKVGGMPVRLHQFIDEFLEYNKQGEDEEEPASVQ